MNLVKWFRKNNSKIMAVVVIVLMIGFIGGSSLTYLLRSTSVTNKTFAYYDDNIKVKQSDLVQAQQEVEILKMIRADNILKALQDPFFQTQDLHSLVLGELLFSEQGATIEVVSYIQQIATERQYRLSNKQINDIYKRKALGFYYWFLLKTEAENAGFRMPNENARDLLSQAAQNVFGQSYMQLIGTMVKRHGISEQQILSTLSKLMAVLRYSHTICAGEDITISQLKHSIAYEEEGLDVEFVEFDSEDFTEDQNSPTEGQIIEHFEKYKQFVPGKITDENPFGFGYKLPPGIELEYIAVKLEDIRNIVKEPSFERQQEFYNINKANIFTSQVRSDPDDPNSPMVTRTQSFSEVADIISEQLINESVNTKATEIIQSARNLAESALQDMNDTELAELSIEKRAELAGSYDDIAGQLSSEYNVKVYSGQTGRLSATDIRNDEHLYTLYLPNYANCYLSQVVFAVDELNLSELGPSETKKPRLFENLGPAKDTKQDISKQIMALVRIIKAEKAVEPESINYTYSTNSFVLDPNQEDTDEDIFSVREKVVEDLKQLAAMDTAKARAEEFFDLISKEDADWISAIEEFNELYGKAQQDVNDPNLSEIELAAKDLKKNIKLENLISLRRLSKATLNTLAMQKEGDPDAENINNEREKGALFVDLLFSLVPQDSNSADFEPLITEFKPDMSYYVIKNISINHLWKETYERAKGIRSYMEDHVESQSMALIHFNPDNIFKRMNFRFIDESNDDTEPNSPGDSEADS